MTLDEIFLKHGTDKGSSGHNYSPYYELMLAAYKERPINLLEIGVYEGASCRAWKDYFTLATIFGVDLTYMPQHNSERIFMIQADQSKYEDLQRLGQTPYDIIIDDGSHDSADQINTFEVLFPMMNAGGLYVIEDLLCAYDARWNSKGFVIDRIRQMIGEVQMNGKVPGSRLCANKPEQIKLYDGDYLEKNIECIVVAMGICFIKKM